MAGVADVKVGVVGAGGRGGSFRAALHSLGATVQAVCDIDADKAAAAKELLRAEHAFTDYEAMLADGGCTCVVIGSPMPFHVAQSIAALERGIHVLCEVTAGITIAECRELVLAAARSEALFMMAENICYDRTAVLINSLVDSGSMGEVYYAEGEYLHNVKSLAVSTPWRRHWQMGIKGLTYCTHALGPIMRWMKGDRIVRVCCEDAGASSHYADAEGEPFAGDAAVMLAKTEAGRLIKIRVDLTSNRPYGLNFELQGTRGVVEVRNGEGQDNWGQGRIALAAAGQEEVEGWSDLPTVLASDLYDALLPAPYKSGSPEAETALQSGHGGSDYYTTATFIAACRGEGEEVVGIHEAMDMTLPGLASQLSAEKGGEWVDVPDSREWAAAGVASGGGAKL